MRLENGNCLPVGGVCTAVNKVFCEIAHNAYDKGFLQCYEMVKERQNNKKHIWVIKKGNKYLHSYRAGRKSWTTKGSGISIWNSADKSTAEFFASAVDGIVVEWDGEQE